MKKNDSQETTERATKEFQRAHRRALAGFLLPTTPPFSNYSASLGNSSTGVTGEAFVLGGRVEMRERDRRKKKLGAKNSLHAKINNSQKPSLPLSLSLYTYT